MKSHAAVLAKKGEPLKIVDVEVADPGAGQVRVKVEACGICRSDLHIIDTGEGVTFPCVLGHEAAGVVESVGAGVTTLKAGDRVILSWTPACGVCPLCLRGQPQLCRKLAMSTGNKGPLSTGGKSLDSFMGLGAFCRHVVVSEKMAIPVRSNMPQTQACLIGCAVMTGFGAAANTGQVRWGETVAVIGCGGVGLSAIMGARIAGAARIFAIDPIEERRKAALSVGATDALAPETATGTVMKETGGGADVAIECVGRSQTMMSAFMMTRPGGRAILVGLASFSDQLSVPAVMFLSEKSLKGSAYGSANPARDFPYLVSLADQRRIDLAVLVGKTRPFEEINEGIKEMREGKLTRVILTM